MSLSAEFWQKLPQRGDRELYDMLAHAEDFLPEALVAIRAELSSRNLPPEQAAGIEARVSVERADEDARAREKLGWPMAILMLILGPGIITVGIIAILYSRNGYKRKAKQSWKMLGVSLLLWALLRLLLFNATRR
jgi:hypothetical protein